MEQPINLCRLPWTGFSNDPDGKVRPCCLFKDSIRSESGEPMYVQTSSPKEIFSSKYMKDLRQQFRNNEKPPACSTCWIDESNGYTSKRQRHNQDKNFIASAGLETDWRDEPTTPIEYQMILSNSCNLKCRSCTPSHSSLWQAELLQHKGSTGYIMPLGQSGSKMGKLWSSRFEWYPSVRRLEVVGGEPFHIIHWKIMFEELISHGYAKNIVLDMSSNATLFDEKLLHNICQNFKSVGIGLSVDGIGPTYEYLRHPGKWDVVYSNMKKYHEFALAYKTLNIQLSYTLSWLNSLDLTSMHSLIYDEFPKFKIWNNLVHYPVHMALWILPEQVKQHLKLQWETFAWKDEYIESIRGATNYMMSKSSTPDEWVKYLDVLLEVDTWRNEDIRRSLPELFGIIEDQ